MRLDPELAAIHREGYLGFRNDLQGLIGDFLKAQGKPSGEAECRRHAIAINGMIDGLWGWRLALRASFSKRPSLWPSPYRRARALLGLPFGGNEHDFD